ncbi:DDE-type integrase/transposase/recombinase [Yanshouia hominis]|uniref:Transposase n=1 Tax=Yanshouia hominis TaxID=2763673 RepID=A0ABR7NMM3_9FIRM|nr:DDE-type integrase/transposase/recombinase [Yanshouia hominis]MBC8577629.1 transposase [Yanshouia hominis]
MSKSITQDMAYRQSLMKYAEKYGVSRDSRKYNKSRSYICFWKTRWDGTAVSLACRSRRPHSHPNQHTEAELKLIRDMRRRNPNLGMVELWHRLRQRGYTRRPESLFRIMRKQGLFPPAGKKEIYRPKPYEQMTYPGQRVQVDVKVVPLRCIAEPELRLFQYTAIDEFTRLRFLALYPEQSTYSSADFLKKLFKWYSHRGIRVECVQTDNGFEFTNRFSNSRRDLPTLFEKTAGDLGIRYRLIRPYTPRHNGKVERSHREDQKRFYSCHSFFSLNDFAKQLAVHNRRSNNFPMRPLGWLSPSEFSVQYV